MIRYSVILPILGTVSAGSINKLRSAVQHAIDGGNPSGAFYGAADLGSRWTVRRNGVVVGTLRYNGVFDLLEDQS